MATKLETLKYEVRMGDTDFYSLKGWHFSVCDALMLTDADAIPARWAFRPSPLGTESGADAPYETLVLLELLDAGQADTESLVALGDWLAEEITQARPEGE